MPLENIFPTPIYYYVPQTKEEISPVVDEVEKILVNYHGKLNNPWDDTIFSSFSYGEKNTFLDNTPLLKNYIGKHILNYMKDVGCKHKNYLIKDSWMNLSVTYSYQNYHNHMADISGVYYHKTSEKDGNLKFRCDSTGLKMSRLFNGIEGGEIEHIPKIGKIVLFPSFLEHAVLMNRTNVERISISFNSYIY